MTDALFDGPGSTSAIKFVEHEGRLVLIWAHEVINDFPLNDGPGTVIRADVVVLDQPGSPPVEYKNTIIFPKMMQGQVRGNVGRGRPNLGRVAKGQAKAGQSAPWILADPTEADKQIATAYLKTPNAVSAEQAPPQGTSYGAGPVTSSTAPPF
jgi:hypothetical protein